MDHLIPVSLVAYVAGCLNVEERDFTVDSNTARLLESFKLWATIKFNSCIYQDLHRSVSETVVQQMRGLASHWFTALHHKYTGKDIDALDK